MQMPIDRVLGGINKSIQSPKLVTRSGPVRIVKNVCPPRMIDGYVLYAFTWRPRRCASMINGLIGMLSIALHFRISLKLCRPAIYLAGGWPLVFERCFFHNQSNNATTIPPN